jgi:hypothetical protein
VKIGSHQLVMMGRLYYFNTLVKRRVIRIVF